MTMGDEKKQDEKKDKHEASAVRRRQLRDADSNSGSIPTVSNFFALERYYEAADKVLQTFETAFEKQRLDEAYVYGLRYCNFCIKGLVEHDYYHSSKFAARKAQTNQRVDRVLTQLEQVAEWMDREELQKEQRRQAILQKQKEERLRKQKEQEEQRLADIERRLAQQQQEFNTFTTNTTPTRNGGNGNGNHNGTDNVEESAMAKLQRLSQPVPPPGDTASDSDKATKKRVSFQQEPDGHSFSTAFPPPLLPPNLQNGQEDTSTNTNTNTNTNRDEAATTSDTPPSYHQIIANQSYFGPGTVGRKSSSTVPGSTPQAPSYESIIKNRTQSSKNNNKPTKKTRLSIRQYISQASKSYREHLQKGWIQTSTLNTYQGRLSGSTNGCTVISACVVSKHLQGRGITDAEIQTIIDRDCIPLLRTIRSKLGLGGGSLIIPSDVHDHMVDHKLLYQHKFVGAAGGNICDPNHLQEVYKMLQGTEGKTQHLKAGATLFFREHVISIVKFPTSPTEAVYDMVDSLPLVNGKASRTRCTSLNSLKVLLQWYTSHKFSDSNITYMERNRWDDNMADFDPRVFQAFVWADLPLPAPTPEAQK